MSVAKEKQQQQKNKGWKYNEFTNLQVLLAQNKKKTETVILRLFTHQLKLMLHLSN